MAERRFYLARPSSGLPSERLLPHGRQKFQPLPRPIGKKPYRLSLDVVLSKERVAEISRSGSITFHTIGDTGGIVNGTPQQMVADAMEADCSSSSPAFFYHLGDVVYFYGEASNYHAQFYEPYLHYPHPIFAIPGNHDGDVTEGGPPTLAAFVENFCSKQPHLTSEAGDAPRDAMTQPNVYWTLEAPFVTMIGLYSNVPEGGEFRKDQLDWLAGELSSAPAGKAVIVSVHHPAYSADNEHGGSAVIEHSLDDAFERSGRIADLVLTGHVHNYQRFTRRFKGRDVPYVVAGSGGYHNLHALNPYYGNQVRVPYRMPNVPGLALESYCVDHYGFMRVQIAPNAILGRYFAVANPGDGWGEPYRLQDSFKVDLEAHHVSSQA